MDENRRLRVLLVRHQQAAAVAQLQQQENMIRTKKENEERLRREIAAREVSWDIASREVSRGGYQ